MSRIDLLARGSNTKAEPEQKKRNTLTVTSIVLVLPPCGIPNLRQADLRPDLPGS
jgi:hypothetical protein